MLISKNKEKIRNKSKRPGSLYLLEIQNHLLVDLQLLLQDHLQKIRKIGLPQKEKSENGQRAEKEKGVEEKQKMDKLDRMLTKISHNNMVWKLKILLLFNPQSKHLGVPKVIVIPVKRKEFRICYLTCHLQLFKKMSLRVSSTHLRTILKIIWKTSTLKIWRRSTIMSMKS